MRTRDTTHTAARQEEAPFPRELRRFKVFGFPEPASGEEQDKSVAKCHQWDGTNEGQDVYLVQLREIHDIGEELWACIPRGRVTTTADGTVLWLEVAGQLMAGVIACTGESDSDSGPEDAAANMSVAWGLRFGDKEDCCPGTVGEKPDRVRFIKTLIEAGRHIVGIAARVWQMIGIYPGSGGQVTATGVTEMEFIDTATLKWEIHRTPATAAGCGYRLTVRGHCLCGGDSSASDEPWSLSDGDPPESTSDSASGSDGTSDSGSSGSCSCVSGDEATSDPVTGTDTNPTVSRSQTTWFNSGAEYAAGWYCVEYVTGCARYANNPAYPDFPAMNGWAVNVDDAYCYHIVNDLGTLDVKAPGADYITNATTEAEAVAASTGASKSFYHPGGKIGVNFSDIIFSDNEASATYGAPKFKLCAV